MSKENDPSNETLDFFKYMDETIRREEAKKAILFPTDAAPAPKEQYNPNLEYQRKYNHQAIDRMWIGPRRYR